MTVQNSPHSLSQAAAAYAPRPALAATPAPLTEAEQTQIADAFPAQPAVAHRLYGPSREVHAPAPLGATLDLSA